MVALGSKLSADTVRESEPPWHKYTVPLAPSADEISKSGIGVKAIARSADGLIMLILLNQYGTHQRKELR